MCIIEDVQIHKESKQIEILENKVTGMMRFFCSTSLSGGNQVDGLPPPRHTEALGMPHGVQVPAAIGILDPRKLEIFRNCELVFGYGLGKIRIVFGTLIC